MSELCFICVNSSDCDWRRHSDQSSYGRGRRRGKVENNRRCSSLMEILTTYLIQVSKSFCRKGEVDQMDELQGQILSSLGNGVFSVCRNCLAKAKDLLDLHLELEKIQMQILDVLKGLQDYLLSRKSAIMTEKRKRGLELLKNFKDDGVTFSRFQDILLQEFIRRDLSDGSKVRLERLEIMGFTSSDTVIPQLSEDTEGFEGGIGMDNTKKEVSINPIKDEVISGDIGYSSIHENYDRKDSPSSSDGTFPPKDTMMECFKGIVMPLPQNETIPSDPDYSFEGEDDQDDSSASFDDPADEDFKPTPLPVPIERDPNRPPSPKRRIRGHQAWECDICLENIPWKQMNAHLKTHSEFEKYYKCDICPHIRWTRKYGTYKGLVWHYVRYNHSVKLPCILCPDQSLMFGSKELCKHLYDTHYVNHKKLQCKADGCSEEFYDHCSLKDHQMRQHDMGAYSCDVCEKRFNYKKCMEKHLKRAHTLSHTERERYQCAFCPKHFISTSGLHHHEKTHEEGWVPTPKPKVSCPHCTKLVANLNTHIKLVHAKSEKSFVCRFCGKAFSTAHHLRRHEDAHLGEKKYKCSKCPYAGTTSGSLQRHMALHRERTFKCRYCPKAFPIKRYWEDHERIHTKEKPYKCDHCEMAFNARNMLSAHRRKKHGIAAVQRCLAGVGVLQEGEDKNNVKVGQNAHVLYDTSVKGDF